MGKENLVLVQYLLSGKKEPFISAIDLKKGDSVVVENETGTFVGKVAGFSRENLNEKPANIIRLATAKDIKKAEENEVKAKDALKKAKEMAKRYDFDMKITSVEYSLDAGRLIFSFVSENRVDFRDFVKELASTFKARIELKQIGSRDEVKACGGIGVCGKVCCCKEFLPDFAKVSIKMAKNQNLSLNPQKINGLCGRLMCCLAYENDAYAKVMAKMPKLGSEVETAQGKGIASYNDVLAEKVSVKFTGADGLVEIKDFPLDEVKVKTYAIKK